MEAWGSLPSLPTLNSNRPVVASSSLRSIPATGDISVQHSLNGEPIATQVLHSVYVIVAEETQADLTEGTGRHHLCHSHLWEEETTSPEGLLTCCSFPKLTQKVGEVGNY